MAENLQIIKIIENMLSDMFKSGMSLNKLGELSGVNRRTLGCYKDKSFAVESMSLEIAQKIINTYPIIDYLTHPYYINDIQGADFILHFPELKSSLKKDKKGKEYFFKKTDYLYWQQVANAVQSIIQNNVPLENAMNPNDYISIWKKHKNID